MHIVNCCSRFPVWKREAGVPENIGAAFRTAKRLQLRNAIEHRHTKEVCMINPNENNLTRDEPLPVQPGEQQFGSGGHEQFRRPTSKFSTAVSHTWDQTKETAVRARERTEYFVRENPVPTILGALGLGIAIGLAIRFASTSEPKAEIEMKSPLGNINWGVLSLPFLWPLFKSAREKYESSAEAMKDGVERLKKIDVNRYAKPIRKRWKAWTR
jgi:hypothetical protein